MTEKRESAGLRKAALICRGMRRRMAKVTILAVCLLLLFADTAFAAAFLPFSAAKDWKGLKEAAAVWEGLRQSAGLEQMDLGMDLESLNWVAGIETLGLDPENLDLSAGLEHLKPGEGLGNLNLGARWEDWKAGHADWIQEGERWRYRLMSGVFVRGGWVEENGVWYYMDSDGNMVSDTVLEIGGHSYSFDANGAWREPAGSEQPFSGLPRGRIEQSVYEHPWAGIRIPLPEHTLALAGDVLGGLSAYDYIPSYYDLLAVVPGGMAVGMVVQYNSDPLEKVLTDDLAVFSNFWGKYDLMPSEPEDAVIAGYPCKRISCRLSDATTMDVYLHGEDHKVWYLLVIAGEENQEDAGRLIGSIMPAE